MIRGKRIYFQTLIFFILILMINLISAQIELSELLGEIDQSVVLLVTIFLISFATIFFALNKSIFKSDPGIAGIVAAMVSFLIIYGMNKVGMNEMNLESISYSIGFSESSVTLALFVSAIIGIIYLVIHFAKNSLIIIGGGLIVLGFFAYEKSLLLFLGIVALGVRIFIPKGKWEPKKKTTP